MSKDNGKKNRLVLRVEMDEEGNMPVTFGGCHDSLISYAITLATLELENKIIGGQIEEERESNITLPDRFIK